MPICRLRVKFRRLKVQFSHLSEQIITKGSLFVSFHKRVVLSYSFSDSAVECCALERLFLNHYWVLASEVLFICHAVAQNSVHVVVPSDITENITKTKWQDMCKIRWPSKLLDNFPKCVNYLPYMSDSMIEICNTFFDTILYLKLHLACDVFESQMRL